MRIEVIGSNPCCNWLQAMLRIGEALKRGVAQDETNIFVFVIKGPVTESDIKKLEKKGLTARVVANPRKQRARK